MAANRHLKINVYSVTEKNHTSYTLRHSSKASVVGYWQVRYFDGEEYVSYNPTRGNDFNQPSYDWFLMNTPTMRDFS